MSPDAPSGSIRRQDGAAPMPGDLVRALEWLRAHLGEPVQLETLAVAAGVRPRTLEAHFKAFLGTTPLEWLRRMRLARARQELLNPAPGTNRDPDRPCQRVHPAGPFRGPIPRSLR